MSRVLYTGCIHLPFEVEGYLQFLKKTYKKYKCNQIVFLGDIIDNHYISSHQNSTNAVGPIEEFNQVKKKLKK